MTLCNGDLQGCWVCECSAQLALDASLRIEIHLLENIHRNCNTAIGSISLQIIVLMMFWYDTVGLVAVGGVLTSLKIGVRHFDGDSSLVLTITL